MLSVSVCVTFLDPPALLELTYCTVSLCGVYDLQIYYEGLNKAVSIVLMEKKNIYLTGQMCQM